MPGERFLVNRWKTRRHDPANTKWQRNPITKHHRHFVVLWNPETLRLVIEFDHACEQCWWCAPEATLCLILRSGVS